MTKKQPFCLMPWIHYHVGDKGMAKACCVANIPYGNVNEQSFDSIWNGEAINRIRDRFMKGEPDSRCGVCLNREKGGTPSIRTETWEKFGDLFSQNKGPIYFDIRFSNVCNFRCRTCWHGASSKWFTEARLLKRNLGDKAIIKNITSFDRFISETGPALKQAREIYLAGGEPLVTEEHYLLLEWLIEQNVRPVLRYNTNFSELKFKHWNVLELWEKFPEVEVMASIDGTEEYGEYIRKEFNWKLFLDNREKIKSLNHIHFKIAPTVSVLNIAHLPDLYKTCLDKDIIAPDDIYLNILDRPYGYNIKSLPSKKKAEIEQLYQNFGMWLSENSASDKIKSAFHSCVQYMCSEDLSSHHKHFLKETKQLDEMRKEDGFNLLEIDSWK